MNPRPHLEIADNEKLPKIKKRAEIQAKKRGEELNTGHLLAALFEGEHLAKNLLLSRRLTCDVILAGTRVAQDDSSSAVAQAIQKAKELATRHSSDRRSTKVKPDEVHLLFALCIDPKTASHRILVQCGIDLTRLRAQALHHLASSSSPSNRGTSPHTSPISVPTLPSRISSSFSPSLSSSSQSPPSFSPTLHHSWASSTFLKRLHLKNRVEFSKEVPHQPPFLHSSSSASLNSELQSSSLLPLKASTTSTTLAPLGPSPSHEKHHRASAKQPAPSHDFFLNQSDKLNPKANDKFGFNRPHKVTKSKNSQQKLGSLSRLVSTSLNISLSDEAFSSKTKRSGERPEDIEKLVSGEASELRSDSQKMETENEAHASKKSGSCLEDEHFDPKIFPMLAECGSNMIFRAKRGDYNFLFGREKEILDSLDRLEKHSSNSVCFIGKAGAGKTSTARRLASYLFSGKNHGITGNLCQPTSLIEINVSTLLAATAARGQLAERLTKLRNEVAMLRQKIVAPQKRALHTEKRELQTAGYASSKNARNLKSQRLTNKDGSHVHLGKKSHLSDLNQGLSIVLFFDNAQSLFCSDASDEALTWFSEFLSSDHVPCLFAMSTEHFTKLESREKAFVRLFSSVEITELTKEESISALKPVAGEFEKYHHVQYTPSLIGILEDAVTWISRYMPNVILLDKAKHALDLAASKTRRRGALNVTRENVAKVVANMAQIPVEKLLESDFERMLALGEHLKRDVLGHVQELDRIAAVLKRNASGFRSPRPIGSFLLLGPTGVGKTETAKAVAKALFDHSDAMSRFDMSEFSESHSVARLVGAPPGYVGHDHGGQLTESVRLKPYQVLLFDEIEKAHRDVLLCLLQVLDEGRLTDSRGRTIDFTQTVIVLTSNLGAEIFSSGSKRSLGFFAHKNGGDQNENGGVYEKENEVLLVAQKALAPEFYNRIDEVLVYAPLSEEDLIQVAKMMLNHLAKELMHQKEIQVFYTDKVLKYLVFEGGYDPKFGARPLRRAIAKYIEAPLAEHILSLKLKPKSSVHIDVDFFTGSGKASNSKKLHFRIDEN